MRVKAGNANLVLSPASQTVGINSSFDVAIQVQANSEQVVGLDAYLDFDPTKLAVNSITPAATWNGKSAIVLQKTFNDVAGQVNFSAGILGDTATGTFTLATVNFFAKASTTNTNITFHFNTSLVRDTGISDSGGNPRLGTATGASVTITGDGMTSSQLVSIAVTPAAPSIAAGQTRQFAAMGTYNDKSIANITSIVTWTSSNVATATIQTTGKANPGLATGLAAGTITITATLGTISATTTLTVTKVEENPTTSPAEPEQKVVTPTPSSTPPSPGETPSTTTPTEEMKTTNTPPAAPVAPVVPGAPPAPPPAPAVMINWVLVGGITAGVVILGFVLYFLLR